MKKLVGVALPFLLLVLASPSDAVNTFVFSRNLTMGSHGADVLSLQQFLAQDSSVYPEGVVSGYFGRLTQAAVKRFQQSRGITPALGYVGPKTRAALGQKASTPEATMGDSLSAILQKLDELKRQLTEAEIQAAASGTTTVVTSMVTEPATTTPTTTPPVTPVPVASNTIMVSGSSTSPLAESAKVGEVTFTNNSTSSALLFHINVTMDEAMNAPHSRGVTFKLTMRNGTSTYDTVLEKKDVTIRSRDPDPGPYNSQLLTFYAGITIPPGEARALSFWSELLVGPFYSGVLRFTITSVTTAPELASIGSAVLTLSQ